MVSRLLDKILKPVKNYLTNVKYFNIKKPLQTLIKNIYLINFNYHQHIYIYIFFTKLIIKKILIKY